METIGRLVYELAHSRDVAALRELLSQRPLPPLDFADPACGATPLEVCFLLFGRSRGAGQIHSNLECALMLLRAGATAHRYHTADGDSGVIGVRICSTFITLL